MRKFPRIITTVYLIAENPVPLPFNFSVSCPPFLILLLNTDHLETHNQVLFHYFTMLRATWLSLQLTSVARSAPSSKALAFSLKLATVPFVLPALGRSPRIQCISAYLAAGAKKVCYLLSCVQLSTSMSCHSQAPLSMRFFRQGS